MNFNNYVTKTVQLNYNNTSNYNIEDETLVKNLKLEAKFYYEVGLDFDFCNGKIDAYDYFMNLLSNYYTKQVNDSSITIKAFSGAGGSDGSLNYNTWESGTQLVIFKNGILYDTRIMGQEFTIPVIDVPANISDDKLNDYIIAEIKKYNESYANDIISITKDAHYFVSFPDEQKVIPNSYVIEVKLSDEEKKYFGEGDGISYRRTSFIIVNKEKVKDLSTKDEKNNIKLDTTTDIVPAGTILKAEKITEGENYNKVVTALGTNVSRFVLYDISLISENAKVQPNGKVKISIPVPEGFDTSKIAVYRVAEDGTKTEYEVTVSDGYIVFETDHFSNYVVAEKGTTNTTAVEETVVPEEITKTEDTTTPAETTNRKKDDTPKTGNVTNNLYIFMTVIIVTGIVFIVKKNKKRVK